MRKLTTIKAISFFMLFLMLFSPLAFASELKMIKASEIQPGQIIVDKDGNEIKVENVATKEKQYATISDIINNLLNKNQNNIDIYSGAGQNGAGIVDLTGMVIGGNLITGETTSDLSKYDGFPVKIGDEVIGSVSAATGEVINIMTNKKVATIAISSDKTSFDVTINGQVIRAAIPAPATSPATTAAATAPVAATPTTAPVPIDPVSQATPAVVAPSVAPPQVVAPLKTFTLQEPITVGITASGKTTNIQVKDIYQRDDGTFFIKSGDVDIAVTSKTKGFEKIITDSGISEDKLAYTLGKSATTIDPDGNVFMYSTKTIGTGAPKLVSSLDGGKTWQNDDSSLPAGLTQNGADITGGATLFKIAENQGIEYYRSGSHVYMKNPDGGYTPLYKSTDTVRSLPLNAIPTKFDVNGNPTEWRSLRDDGATIISSVKTLDNGNKYLSTSVDRGQVKTMFGTMNFFGGHLVQGLQWAVAVGGLVKFFGGITGAKESEVNAVSFALAGGIMAGKLSYALLGRGGTSYFNANKIISNIVAAPIPGIEADQVSRLLSSPYFSFAVGAASAWLIYNSMWEKETSRTEIVTFKCMPWQAPHGGKDCELCNSDPTLPCSEYRCKSLGQTCGIINAGTSSEKCVNQNIRDVAPPIINPYKEVLDPTDLKYTDVKSNPPGAGFKIKSSQTTTGCIKPYTPITFGVQTNEPAQCKIDYVEGKNYSQMATYLGGTNIYDYNHTETLSLPSADSFKNSSISLQNGKELNLFIKCKDSMGNINEADYEMSLCVDPSDDTTPPMISVTSIPSDSCVSSNSMNSTISFYVNEPAECRWSSQDQSYENMQNNMTCANSVTEINALQLYTCNTILTGISQSGTDFYVRCKDQPGINESKRNKNAESYKFSLRSSNPLKMGAIKPNETIFGSISPMPVELSTSTLFGCDNGQSVCFYSTTGAENSFVQFFDTNKADGIHTQRLDLTSGTYTYTVKCVDAGGNVAENTTSFNVDIDPNAPLIARVYEEDDYLKIVSPQNTECFFSNENCDFYNEGSPMPYANSTTHVTPWFSDKTYYIKCKDDYRSLPTDCSIIIRPTENFL